MRLRLRSRTGSRRRSSSGGGRIACAPRECRPNLANVRPTDRTTPEERFPPELARRCGRRACRVPTKMARWLVALRQNAAIARRRFRQARSEARTCVACFDTVIDYTAAAADTAADWDRSSAAVVDTPVDWNSSSVAGANIAVGRNGSWG